MEPFSGYAAIESFGFSTKITNACGDVVGVQCCSDGVPCVPPLSRKFREAFECMRKLRINLNFMYDHNPKVSLPAAPTSYVKGELRCKMSRLMNTELRVCTRATELRP